MANKTLLTYKDRLINFSGRNQTLCRNKLYAVRAFDLVRLKQVKENIPEEILMSLINDDENEHKILKRATDLELSKEEISYIENNYIKMLDKKAVTLEFDKIQIEILKQDTDDKLKEKVIEILKDEKLKEKIDMYHRISLNLDKLFNEIDTKERETGLYELYTGFPFIEGKLLDGKNVRAPLFLFPSSITKRDGEWYYKNLNKEKIYINRVFLMAYKDSNKISIEHIEEEYEEVEEFFKDENKIKKISDFLEKCRKWGENNNIKIKNDLFVDNFELMKDYRKESYNNYKDGELFLRNNFILGQYSVGSNVIYKDIEEMAKEEELPESVEYFLKEDINSIESYGEGNAFFNKSSIEISEKESFFITDLDYSQEKAVKMAEILDNLVIYGPPGTGKSQVIANIVSDYIAKGKKVLVVSEKSTALAVVYKRLEKVGLNSRIAFIHDSKRDRKSLLEKIVSNYETVVSEELNENVNIHDKSDEIQNKIDRLDKLKNELYKERKYKVSLYKLYTHSKLNKSFLEDIVINFENYNFFDFYSLRELLKKMQQIKEYIKYDSKETLVSTWKSFSETSGLVKKLILEKLEILEKLIENSSLNSLNIKIKEFIENINIENIWKERNKEFILLYDDAEELILKLNDYENICLW